MLENLQCGGTGSRQFQIRRLGGQDVILRGLNYIQKMGVVSLNCFQIVDDGGMKGSFHPTPTHPTPPF